MQQLATKNIWECFLTFFLVTLEQNIISQTGVKWSILPLLWRGNVPKAQDPSSVDQINILKQYFYYNNLKTVTRSPLHYFSMPLLIHMLRSPQVTKIESSIEKDTKNILVIFYLPSKFRRVRKGVRSMCKVFLSVNIQYEVSRFQKLDKEAQHGYTMQISHCYGMNLQFPIMDHTTWGINIGIIHEGEDIYGNF